MLKRATGKVLQALEQARGYKVVMLLKLSLAAIPGSTALWRADN